MHAFKRVLILNQEAKGQGRLKEILNLILSKDFQIFCFFPLVTGQRQTQTVQ